MKRLIMTGCLAVMFLGLAAPAFAHMSKVGFVNPQRIINESRIGRIAQDDLARLGREKDRRVGEALTELEAMRVELENGVFSLTEEQNREKALRLAAREYEQLVETSNLDLQGEERRLIQFVMRQTDTILREVAKEMGFSMILTDPEIIGFVDDSMDITDRVIRQLDSMM